MLEEFYQIAFRKKIYRTLEELQADVDAWLQTYNEERTHQGKMCCGRTPWEPFKMGWLSFMKSILETQLESDATDSRTSH